MMPNDLYLELVPPHRSRASTERMFFPLLTKRPDSYLKVPRRTQCLRGNRGIVSYLRVTGMLKRLGL